MEGKETPTIKDEIKQHTSHLGRMPMGEFFLGLFSD